MKVVVYAPPYTHRSGGVHLLHWLAHELRSVGVDCRTLFYTRYEPVFDPRPLAMPPFHLAGPVVTDPAELVAATVIYPEVIHGHPLEDFKVGRVVRWLLNKDGGITRPIEWGRDDVPVTFSRVFHPTAPLLHYPFYDTALFSLAGSIRSLDRRPLVLSYTGKGNSVTVPDDDSATTAFAILTRDWPGDRLLYARLLKECRVLYSSDPWTAVLTEALLCGAAPVVVDWRGWSLEECLAAEVNDVYRLNAGGDTGPDAVLAARASALAKVAALRAAWPDALRAFVRLIGAGGAAGAWDSPEVRQECLHRLPA